MRAALDFISKDVKQYMEQNGLDFIDNDFELLMTASDLVRGRGNLDFFLHCYDAYKKSVRQEMNHEIKGIGRSVIIGSSSKEVIVI